MFHVTKNIYMNNKYVVSLDLAKKLREAGVPQISEYYWCNAGGSSEIIGPIKPEDMSESRINDHFRPDDVLTGKRKHFHVYYSAFSIGELGEMLPRKLSFRKKDEFWLVASEIWDSGKGWACGYRNALHWETFCESDTEAEARGLCLLYLMSKELDAFLVQSGQRCFAEK